MVFMNQPPLIRLVPWSDQFDESYDSIPQDQYWYFVDDLLEIYNT